MGRMCHRVVKNPLDKQARRRYTLNVKVIKADTKISRPGGDNEWIIKGEETPC